MTKLGVVGVSLLVVVVAGGSVAANPSPRPRADNVAVVDGRPLILSVGGHAERIEFGNFQYRATSRGGFRARGGYVVKITRDGRTRAYYAGECAPKGTIAVGDLVSVEVYRGVVLAGSRYGC